MYHARMTRRPSHPGEILEGLYMESSGITTPELAEKIGVPVDVLSKIINGEASMTLDIATRLSKVFAPDPQSWLNIQRSLDEWLARQAKQSQADSSSSMGDRLIEAPAH